MDEGTCAFPLHGIEGVLPESFLISSDRLRLPLPAPAEQTQAAENDGKRHLSVKVLRTLQDDFSP
jgi:hypothetical protein